MGDFHHRFEIIIFKVNMLICPENSANFYFISVAIFYGSIPIQSRINFLLFQEFTDIFTGERLNGIGRPVKNGKITNFIVLLFFHPMNGKTGSLLRKLIFVIWNEIFRFQPLQRILPNQQGKIRKFFQECFIVPVIINNDLGYAE